jgi:hypothetical protein
MVARPSVILSDDTKNIFDGDFLAATFRSVREIGMTYAVELEARSFISHGVGVSWRPAV